MPTLVITKSYADGDILFEADLDNIKDDLENFLNVTKINDDNIQSAGITGSTKLVDASVSTSKLASASVTTSKIADDAVTTGKIIDSAVTTAKIADNAITSAKAPVGGFTSAFYADASVTQAKRSASNYQLSSSSGNSGQTTSTSFTDVTNLSVTITTNGRPVMVGICSDGTDNFSDMNSGGGVMNLQILRDATVILKKAAETSNYPTTPNLLEAPAAGTYTYKAQFRSSSGAIVYCRYAKLYAIEIG